MKQKVLTLSMMLLVCAFGLAAQKQKLRYPRVASVSGDVHLVETSVRVENKLPQVSEVSKVLKVGASLREKATIKTGEKGQARIELSPDETLLIDENSLVELPVITWEKGDVEKIILHKGRLRFSSADGPPRLMITDLFQDLLPAGDYVLTYEPQVPKLEMLVLEGSFNFKGLENEEGVLLKSGQKASFVGQLDAGEVAYDILLQGRKVARGKLTEATSLSDKDLEPYKKAMEPKKPKAFAKKQPRTAAEICDKPVGELNECAYNCENNPKKSKTCAVDQGASCVMTRCNANGEWADRQVLGKSQNLCKTTPQVSTCP